MERLEKIALELKKGEEEYSRLGWTQYTTGYDFGVEKQYKLLMDKLTSKSDFAIIKELHDRTDLNQVDTRKAEFMYQEYEGFHKSQEINDLMQQIQSLTTKLSSILNTFRSSIDGVEYSSVDIAQILRTEDDRDKRKKAYLSRTQINKKMVDGGFIELINLRKELAKLQGYNDFVEMSLHDSGLKPEMFFNWKDQLNEMLPKMNKARTEVANKYLKCDQTMPWDESYVSSKIAPSLNAKVDMSEYYKVLRDFFLHFGIDISKYNITYDVFPRANKSEWGYNFPISPGKDSRILANVKNQYSEYGVLMHESGHAVHSFLLDPKETILNMGVSGIISEGIANLFGGFLYDEIFYKNFFGDDKKVAEELKTYKEYQGVNSLRAISTIMFDQNLYRTDIKTLADINDLAFNTNEDYLGDKRFGDEYPWGVRIHHTTHPIYLHNYFMGDVTCEMLKKNFCSKYNCASVIDKPKEFADYLIEQVIKPSGLYTYPELFKRISGEEFSLKYMM